ncbi:MAG: hypothetical protein JSU68_00870 [Phycisphaerales bacterium]|nr:MAG: hypothetical protein JSU68_00870 [Phycisphaerales bacterium]
MSSASATGRGSAAPNLCAHLAFLCAILPLAIVLLLLIVDETSTDLLGACTRASDILVPLITLAGAICGLLGARCYWRDTRRGGIGVLTIGLLGCGIWVLWYQDIRDLVMGLL